MEYMHLSSISFHPFNEYPNNRTQAYFIPLCIFSSIQI